MSDQLDAFLQHVFGDVAEDEIIGIVQRGKDGRGWTTMPYKKGRTKLRPDAASYYCISTLKKSPAGEPLRRLIANMRECHVIVLDDIGTKIPWSKFDGKPAFHYVMETSPGNFQIGLKFKGALEEAQVLIEALIEAGYSDPGARDVHRLVRLPGSANYKCDPPFVSRLVEENWDNPRFTFEEMAAEFGVTPREPTALRPPQAAWLGDPKDDVVFEWLLEQGMVLSAPKADGWAFIECPWGHEHSDGRTDAKWHIGPGTTGAWHCFHGSCQERDTKAFRLWCEANGAPDFQAKWAEKMATDGARLRALMTPEQQKTAMGGGKRSVADRLVALADGFDLYCVPGGNAYADIQIDGHRETHPVRSERLSQLLTHKYFTAHGSAPNMEGMKSALATLAAKAAHGGIVRQVFVRTAEKDGTIYIDLGGPDWRVVEVTASGWRIIADPPVRFRRAAGALPLAEPQRGESLEVLFRLLNLDGDARLLAIAWLLGALRGQGPYPVLAVAGEQGTAKTTTCKMLRAIVDPNVAPMRNLPRQEQDLFIAAQNGFVQAFDNLSHMPHWASDAICRLATGGGFAARRLYSDTDEVLIDVSRPAIMNGIGDLAERGDLASRAIPLTLQPIPPERRMAEAELWAAFHAALPGTLGALLDLMVVGLHRLPSVKLAGLPRMADFTRWAVACDQTGRFEEVYAKTCREAQAVALSSHPVTEALRTLLLLRPEHEWCGTWSALLAALTPHRPIGCREWPSTGKGLSNLMRRLAPALREAGCDWEEQGHSRAGNPIHIRWR